MSLYVDDRAPPFEQAVQFVQLQIADLPNIFGCELEDMNQLSFVDLFIVMRPGIETHVSPDETTVWHEVSESIAFQLVGAASSTREAYDICREIASRNTYNGAPLPYSLRCFSAKVLSGTFSAPKKTAGKPSSEFAAQWVLSQLARSCATAFELKLTRGDGAPHHSACDAVVEALERRDGRLKASHDAIRDWCHHAKYRKLREKSAVLQFLLADEATIRLGLARKNST